MLVCTHKLLTKPYRYMQMHTKAPNYTQIHANTYKDIQNEYFKLLRNNHLITHLQSQTLQSQTHKPTNTISRQPLLLSVLEYPCVCSYLISRISYLMSHFSYSHSHNLLLSLNPIGGKGSLRNGLLCRQPNSAK